MNTSDILEMRNHIRILKRKFTELDVNDIASTVHDAFMRHVGYGLRYTDAYRACIKLMRKPNGVPRGITVVELHGNIESPSEGLKQRVAESQIDFDESLLRQPLLVQLLVATAKAEAEELSKAGCAIWDFGAVPMLQGRVRDRFVRELGCSMAKYYEVRKELVAWLRSLNRHTGGGGKLG